MSITKFAAAAITITLIAACGTLEENAWMSGVRPNDAMQIKHAVMSEKHAHEVYEYSREDDGSILIQTDVGAFKARRVRGRWTFVEVVIIA